MTDDRRPAARRPVARALLSVSDKSGLADLARGLAARGAALVSTGATAAALRGAGLAVTEVAEVTGHPEMLGGRVKTLHPRVHGGLLARAGDPAHEAEIAAHGIAPFDLLVVNLYPFEAAVARGAPWEETVEEIDVGGPAMIRAGAKNHASVAVLTDPGDYPTLLAELDVGGTTLAFRRAMAGKAFARMAEYDAAIASHFEDAGGEVAPRTPPAGRLIRRLRYGENPHQRAAFYEAGPERAGVATATQVGGKDLGLNNIADADAAFELVAEVAAPACAIVKHANPCGVGTGATLAEAHARALASDPVSAFGGVVAVNRPLDEAAALSIAAVFTEVVIAPDADDAARAVLARKPNLRLLLAGAVPDPAGPGVVVRSVAGGLLVQDRDAGSLDGAALTVATSRAPTEGEMAELRLAWITAKHARSNAIVLAANGATVGIGAGQTSRVDAVRQAVARMRAHNAGAVPVLASDAFFPFADGLEAAAEAGVTAVIQPGGSRADADVVAAADRAGLAMVFTAMRHFRH